jgi:hypothetical protein
MEDRLAAIATPEDAIDDVQILVLGVNADMGAKVTLLRRSHRQRKKPILFIDQYIEIYKPTWLVRMATDGLNFLIPVPYTTLYASPSSTKRSRKSNIPNSSGCANKLLDKAPDPGTQARR